MQLNPSEISELIKSKIQNLQGATEVRTQGTVVSVTDGICRVHGLADVMQGEMLEFPGNTFGMALNLERDSVGAVVLGSYEHITEGDTVKCTGRILDVPVGPELIGRVVNSLGQPIDGKGPINAKQSDIIEKVAPGVIWRKSVSEPVQTGLKSIDAMVPVGRGQRELIIGDRQTGKTAVAIDTIINQKGKDLICIYVAVGQDPEHGEGVGNITCIDATKTCDITKTGRILSHYKIHRSISTVSITPEGLLFVADFSGYLHCFDAETGELYWRHDLKAHIWGSTLVADGKVYIGDEDGDVAVFAASKEKKLLDGFLAGRDRVQEAVEQAAVQERLL